MPTSDNEARKIQEIINDFLTPEQAREVAQKTDNDSLKVSLIMLRRLYE